VISQVH